MRNIYLRKNNNRFYVFGLIFCFVLFEFNCFCSAKQDVHISTIKVNISNHSNENDVVQIQILDWVTGEPVNYSSPIDSLGNSELKIALTSVQDLTLKYGNIRFNFIAYPQSYLNIFLDEKDNHFIKFSGKGSKLNYEFLNYSNYYTAQLKTGNISYYIAKTKDFELYKKYTDSIYLKNQKVLTEYFKRNNSSSFLRKIVGEDLKYDYLCNLLIFKNKNDKLKGNKFKMDSGFLYSIIQNNFLKKSFPPNFILRNQNYFLRDLMTYFANISGGNAKLITSDQQQYANNQFIRFCSTLEKYNIEPNLSETLKARWYYYSYHMLQRIVSYDTVYNNLNSTFIKQYISQIDIASDTLTFSNGILSKIVNDNKGKVVYIDFWATWCGVCYKQFEKLKEIKKVYENKDVVFINLCCESDFKTYLNVIKDKKLSDNSFFINVQDFSELNKTLSISGYPRYVILDKKGNIVHKNAPSPSSPFITPFLDALLNQN